jgi:hypothetical protein
VLVINKVKLLVLVIINISNKKKYVNEKSKLVTLKCKKNKRE